MTEPNTEATTTPSADALPDDSLALPENLEAARKLRQENKRLRERLHTLEGDYEAAITRLGALQHAEIERAAAEHLIDPSDIWAAQTDEAAFLDDEYRMVDSAKVAEVAKALVSEKPHLAADYKPVQRPPTDRPIEGLRPGATPPSDPTPEPTWASAIRGSAR